MLVADDFPLIRMAIREELEEAGLEVCAEVADAAAAVEAARLLRPDVCLLDVRMPGDGIAAAAAIVEERPDAKVILLTAVPSEGDVVASLDAGASGYLLKDVDHARLALIVLEVAAGEVAFPRSVMRELVDRVRAAAAAAA